MKISHFLGTTLALGLTAAPVVAETWVADPGHTQVIVSWTHAGFSTQALTIGGFEGSMEYTEGDVANASADFSVDPNTIITPVEIFTKDLLGEGFFNVEVFPKVNFVSTSVEQTGDMTVKVTGDLTLRDVTKPMTFDVTVNKIGEHPVGQFADYYKGTWMGITATAEINRSDWGFDGFIPIGSDTLNIVINSELKAQ